MNRPSSPSASPGGLERLYARNRAGIQPGLNSIRRLLAALDGPERSFLSIHVAGTNGKGSVCALLESSLRHSGFKTGLYTSPHLIRFNERIRVDGLEVPDADLERLLARADEADGRTAREAGDRPCTFFELSTAMAFRHFADQGVQVAVVEVGMGGRWDATNTALPAVTVIQPVSMDHMEYLGGTLAAIAGEKAGILKRGARAVVSAQPPAALEVIEAEARRLGVTLRMVPGQVKVSARRPEPGGQSFRLETARADYGRVRIALPGAHQAGNTAAAVLALEALYEALGMEPDSARWVEGMGKARWPGRCQLLGGTPPVLLDGAHNPAAAKVLEAALRELYPRQKGVFVVSAFADKDLAGILAALKPRIASAIAVPMAGERARPESALAGDLAAAGLSPLVLPLREALAEARRRAEAAGTYVCVTGSLFLVGDALALPFPGGAA